jgi:hypothetical protein
VAPPPPLCDDESGRAGDQLAGEGGWTSFANAHMNPATATIPEMVWHDQDPAATDVLLDFTVPFSGGGSPAYLEIDKLPDGRYRATVGTLFEFQELCRIGDLEGLRRHTRAVQSSGSFDEMVCAIRAMRAFDDGTH